MGDHLNNLEWHKYEQYILGLFGYQPKEKTAISVVVPAWNEEKTIYKTFYSLSRQQTKVPFEVVLVDNNCTDNTVNIVKSFNQSITNLRVIYEKTQGIGAARNSGFYSAISELIASTDADTIVPENWISKIYGRFWDDKNLAALVGIFSFFSKGDIFNSATRYIEITTDYLHKLMIGSFAFRGANFAIRKTFWEEAGGFNPKISALEDVELSLRVGEIGKIVYLPDLTVSTTYRRFEGRFLRQLLIRTTAYIYRVFLNNFEKHTDWEPIR
jgi:cellulose synthase/poly-beta-1,6-N-acetylglucosamine synthase-like glycosyltransferase